jgi:hypothetical protein
MFRAVQRSLSLTASSKYAPPQPNAASGLCLPVPLAICAAGESRCVTACTRWRGGVRLHTRRGGS